MKASCLKCPKWPRFCKNCVGENIGRDLQTLGTSGGIPEAVEIFCVCVLFLNSKGSFDKLKALDVISCGMVLCLVLNYKMS